ncbi:MAG: hypothetical protein KatS3mg068_1390 [Candidatus Sericytochromatia bacterium]|nr:MAG: hypothetical protein KatS3mg068_1390 [Candidatus Sericytochromatia bacterium]
MPEILIKNDFGIIHLGNGKHQFVKGINKVYHDFEEIQETIEWKYKKSLLNEYNDSESNILSVANNQRILHHFLFEKDKNGNPKSFAIYQIYHPFLYYHKANQDSKIKGKIKNIYCVYVVKNIINKITNLKIWSYTFENP